MGRGKPFQRSIKKLSDAGVIPRPIWLSTVEATKPKFQPRSDQKIRPIVYPEDRLRNTFLLRNPNARRMPVNLYAENKQDRHIADRFVELQLKLMEQDGMLEEDAYQAAQNIFNQTAKQLQSDSDYILVDETIQNDTAKLYLASLKDSKRDQKMHRVLVRQSNSQQD